MDDLAHWLGEQLDEDERIARAADVDLSNLTGCVEIEYPEIKADEEHALRHSPARVLREIEAKRRLLAEVLRYEAKIDGEWGCCHDADEIAAGECAETQPQDVTALRLLALPYTDRPGFQESWRP